MSEKVSESKDGEKGGREWTVIPREMSRKLGVDGRSRREAFREKKEGAMCGEKSKLSWLAGQEKNPFFARVMFCWHCEFHQRSKFKQWTH